MERSALYKHFRGLFHKTFNGQTFRDNTVKAFDSIYGRNDRPFKEIIGVLQKPWGLEIEFEQWRKNQSNIDQGSSGDHFYITMLFWLFVNRTDEKIGQQCLTELRYVVETLWEHTFEKQCEFKGVPNLFEVTFSPDPLLDIQSKTAPFKWPLHVPKEKAFPKKDEGAFPDGWLEAIWLNPHNHFAIPLSSRGAERDLLDKFIKDDRLFLIGAVIAPSGAGKTRLVSEWMRRYMAKPEYIEEYGDNGWDAGFVDNRDPNPWHEWEPTKNTLIVIDYTYNYSQVMEAIVDRFKDQATQKIRLLILDHVLPDKLHEDFVWKQQFSESGTFEAEQSSFFNPFPIVLKPEADQSILLREVIARAADPYSEEKRFDPDSPVVIKAAEALMKIGEIAEESPTEDQIHRRDSVRHPLFAALIGQTLYQNPNEGFSGWSRRDLITHYFENGQRIPWEKIEQNQYADTLGPWVGCYVCAATLQRGFPVRDLRARMPKIARAGLSDGAQVNDLVDYCNRIVSSNDRHTIKPFEPDILGEAFCLKFIENFIGKEEVFDAFVEILNTFRSPNLEEKATTAFLETLQRLVRNLINDDQNIDAVRTSWVSLFDFLNPERFPKSSLMRQAVSVALCDAIKQCRTAELDELITQFADQVNLEDLCTEVSSVLWYRSATAIIHYHDWVAFEDRMDERTEKALIRILKSCKERSETKWSALMMAAHEGCLHTAESVRYFFGEDLNSSQNEGWSVLMVASHRRDGLMVDWLINQGADPNYTLSSDGKTALMAASHAGHLDIVERLIGAGAKVDQRTKRDGGTALFIASYEGHLDIVECLIEAGASVDQRTNCEGATPLTAAILAGHLGIAERLVEAGATVDQRGTDDGRTALIIAVDEGNLDIVEYLIGAGATVDLATTDDGTTALIEASLAGHLDIVECLIGAGAAVDQGTADDGITALITASLAGRLDIVECLIGAGAAVDQGKADDGITALITASLAGHLDVVDCLIRADATVDCDSAQDGMTALLIASLSGHLDVVERLIKAGAKVDKGSTDDGRTALMLAGFAGYLHVVDCLVDANAKVDLGTTNYNKTALMFASEAGHLDVVERLIERGVDVNAPNKFGLNALMLAKVYEHAPVAAALVAAGGVNLPTTEILKSWRNIISEVLSDLKPNKFLSLLNEFSRKLKRRPSKR